MNIKLYCRYLYLIAICPPFWYGVRCGFCLDYNNIKLPNYSNYYMKLRDVKYKLNKLKGEELSLYLESINIQKQKKEFVNEVDDFIKENKLLKENPNLTSGEINTIDTLNYFLERLKADETRS